MGASPTTIDSIRPQPVKRTMCEAFDYTVDTHPDRVATRTLDGPERTWAEARERVHRLAGGLTAMGVGRGATVAMLLASRPEFLLVDMATLTAGGTSMSIYLTSPAEDIVYLLEDADIAVLVTEEQFEPTVRAAIEQSRVKPRVLVLAAEGDAGLQPVLDACPEDYDGAAASKAVQPGDVAQLVYTSGTTGPPKGVQLTHANLMASWKAASSLHPRIHDLERVISYLPAAHVADRLWSYLVAVRTGASITYLPDPKQIMAAMEAVRPSLLLGVPRIWEKLRIALLASVPEGKRPGDPDVAPMLRDRIGLTTESVVITGAAPIDSTVLDFYDEIGIELYEGYGMTETSAVISSTRPGKRRHGTVGVPFDGVEVSIAVDGEILVRGQDVPMLGYRNKPEKTAEALDADGWLHTGDIGSFDEDGFLTIVDRKKEIIITAGGKNLSPANIENTVRSSTSLVGPVLAVGDRRPYVTMVVSLDPDESRAWAAANGVPDADPARMAQDERVRAAVEAAIDDANSHLPKVARVRRFTIVPDVWDPASGNVTPTLKLKRRVVQEVYAEEIEELYG